MSGMATTREGLKIYLDADQVAALRDEAEREGKTVTGIVRVLVRDHLARQSNEPSGSREEATLGSSPTGG